MDNKDKDLKKALDDIFGSDFIEIDVDKNNKINKKEDNVLNFTDSNHEDLNDINNQENTNKSINNVSIEKENNSIKEKNELKNNENLSNNVLVNTESFSKNIKQNKGDNLNKKNTVSNKKIIIWFVIGFLIGIILIFLLVNYAFNTQKVMNCHQSASDTGYEYTDEYKITYKQNEILYVESSYTYTALTDEYKSQIDFIKNERLPVIINSNGMKGFTYTYEVSDDSFKVNGYLDFDLFDFNEIDKINQDLMPISYFKFDSKTTYNQLISNFEKQGYECIPTS